MIVKIGKKVPAEKSGFNAESNDGSKKKYKIQKN